jgi:hypothetical protein
MKQRIEIIALIALLAVAAAVWFYKRPKPTAAAAAAFFTQTYKPMDVEDSELHFVDLIAAQKTEYKSNGRNIFSPIAPPPPVDPKKAAELQPKQITTPQPVVPQAPTLPVKFFGYGTVPNGTARRAFFTDGEDVYIVSEGETLLGRYRILHIGNVNLDFEELSTGRRGTAVLEEPSTGPSA